MRALLLLGSVLLLAGCAATPSHERARALQAAARCDACGHPTGPDRDGVRWSDGRVSCAACRATAVQDLETARAVLTEAAQQLDRTLHLAVRLDHVDLQLVARAALMRSAGELAHPNLRAFTEITELLRNGVVTERRFRIRVLWGLPRTALLGILAHELFHVWQTRQGGTRPAADPAFREGAATYAQYRVLLALEAQRWASLIHDDPDPTYGGGLRRYLRLVEVEGEKRALQLGATRDRFPPGF